MANNFIKLKFAFLIIWTILILYYSIRFTIPPTGESGSFRLPGIEHISAYFIFAILLFLVLKEYKIRHLFVASILITFMYGLGIEIIQIFIPWRNFSISDSLFNLIGSSLIILFKPLLVIK